MGDIAPGMLKRIKSKVATAQLAKQMKHANFLAGPWARQATVRHSQPNSNIFKKAWTVSTFSSPSSSVKSKFQRQENIKYKIDEEYQSDDSEELLKKLKPFKKFHMDEEEMEGMREAFDLFKDRDGCISVRSLFERIKDK